MSNETNTRKSNKTGNRVQRKLDDVITMTLKTPCESAILKDFMDRSQGLMLSMFERLGGLSQMVSKEKKLLAMIRLWQQTNLRIAHKQLEEITARREAVTLQYGDDLELPKLNIPNWELKFEATHPACHEMIKLISKVNGEIKENEKLFFAGVIDEEGIERVKREALTTMSGVIDRIAKATSPGKRVPNGGEKSVYAPAQLTAYIRKGFRLDFADAPQSFIDLIEEYETQTANFKTVINRKTIDQGEKAA